MDSPPRVTPRRALVLAAAVACLTSCGDGESEDSRPDRTSAPSPQEIVIETRIAGFDGEVLAGSVLGGAAFCPGGTLHHEHGSHEIGFPAVNVFTCPAGTLSIGFGPGPGQMDQSVQTSSWRVLEGSGDFAGATGEGTMRVEFEEGADLRGRETFTGVVAVR